MTMLDVLSEEFARIGYSLQATVLDAADCGVPQKRKRAIIVAVPKGQAFDFPLVSQRQPTTVGESIR